MVLLVTQKMQLKNRGWRGQSENTGALMSGLNFEFISIFPAKFGRTKVKCKSNLPKTGRKIKIL